MGVRSERHSALANRYARSLRSGTVVGAVVVLGVTALLATPAAAAPAAAHREAAAVQVKNPAVKHTAKTLARLLVVTPAQRAKHAVTFSLAGTRVAAHSHVRREVLSFGDGTKVHPKHLSGTLRHTYIKPGVYHPKLVLTDSHGHRSRARRVVAIAGPNRVVLKANVRKLPASDLADVKALGASTERITLHAGVEKPAKGQVLFISKGSLEPNGLIAVVDSVTSGAAGTTVVDSHDGTLASLYSKLRALSASHIGKQVQLVRTSASPRGVRSHAVSSSHIPFSCSGSGGPSIDLSADFTNTHISTVVDVPNQIFSFNLIAKPTMSADFGFSGSVSCHLPDGFEISVPIPAIPGVTADAGLFFTLSASGAITAEYSWSPKVFLTFNSDHGHVTKFMQFNNAASGSSSGSASVTLSGGIKVGLSVARAAGLEVSAGPTVTATGSIDVNQYCFALTSALEVSADLYAHAFGIINANVPLYHGTFDKSTIFNVCKPFSSGPGSAGGSGSSSSQSGGSSGTSGGGSAPPYLGPTVSETVGSIAHTFTDYVHAGGEGPNSIANGQTVGIVCKIHGFQVADGNTWWYLIGSSPWNAVYYVSADAFYNGAPVNGNLHGTPFVDTNVPDCAGSVGSSPTPVTPPPGSTGQVGKTYTETTGSVAHTFTDYNGPSGQGTSIASNASVQITCRTTGFQVADGNTWWYRIASDPWDNMYYVSADAFYNDGATSGSLKGTPFVDTTVPTCGSDVSPPPPPPSTYLETTGSVAHTWTNYTNAGGTEGPSIASNAGVQITCALTGFQVADGNTWWYQIASSPWNNAYYVSADAFYNNGSTSGSLQGTPFVDPAVPVCGSAAPGYTETTGSVAHTWTNYTNAGGTEGPEIGSNASVKISCRLTGFQVADGNTWWYRISSSPWNDNYYVSADAFYNNGATSGSLHGTPFVDTNVPTC